MKLKNVFIGIIGIATLEACSDFLEEQSQDEVIVRTVTDYSQFLLGSAYDMRNSGEILYLLDDDVALEEKQYYGGDNANAINYFGYFTWQPDMWERWYKITDAYVSIYGQLKGVNATLDGIDEATGSDVERDYVKAEALGLRGYYYFMLINLYGEPYNHNKQSLGVPLKLTAGLVENGIERNTVEEVYTQIVKDLTASAELFDRHPKRGKNYRFNQTCAYIMLSRVYLYMEQWENVEKAASKAIETAEGLTNYTTLVSITTASYSNSEVEWIYGAGAVRSGYRPSQELYDQFEDNDLRKKFWFSNGFSGFTTSKKIGDYAASSSAPTNTIRISEAYLNRAEAYAQMKGNETKAIADLNALRRYRIIDYQDITDAADLLQEIRQERRRELCFDEHRWFDLRRYGMPSIAHRYKAAKEDKWLTFTLREKDPLYTLPFSNLVMMNNNSLKQNASRNESQRKGAENE